MVANLAPERFLIEGDNPPSGFNQGKSLEELETKFPSVPRLPVEPQPAPATDKRGELLALEVRLYDREQHVAVREKALADAVKAARYEEIWIAFWAVLISFIAAFAMSKNFQLVGLGVAAIATLILCWSVVGGWNGARKYARHVWHVAFALGLVCLLANPASAQTTQPSAKPPAVNLTKVVPPAAKSLAGPVTQPPAVQEAQSTVVTTTTPTKVTVEPSTAVDAGGAGFEVIESIIPPKKDGFERRFVSYAPNDLTKELGTDCKNDNKAGTAGKKNWRDVGKTLRDSNASLDPNATSVTTYIYKPVLPKGGMVKIAINGEMKMVKSSPEGDLAIVVPLIRKDADGKSEPIIGVVEFFDDVYGPNTNERIEANFDVSYPVCHGQKFPILTGSGEVARLKSSGKVWTGFVGKK